MVYRLDIDPQATVQPQVFHISVTWPAGYHTDQALPTGWKATAHGARFDGTVTTIEAWEIPLSRA